MRSQKTIRLETPVSSSSSSSIPPIPPPPRYWRCPFGLETKREGDVKETKRIEGKTETKEIKTKCIPTSEPTRYLSEIDCDKECNLLSQLPSALFYEMGLMIPKETAKLLPLVSKTIKAKPETKADKLIQTARIEQEIDRIYSSVTETKDVLTILKSLLSGNLGEKRITIPLILRVFILMMERDSDIVESKSFNEVLDNALDIALKSELVDSVAMIYYYIGNAYRSMDNFDKALESYNKSLSFKENFNTYYAIASIYSRLNDCEKAITNYNRALLTLQLPGSTHFKLAPDPNIYYNRAICYERLEDYKRAIDDFSKIIGELNYKNLPLIYYKRGRDYAEIKEDDNAIQDLETFISTVPDLLSGNKLVPDAYNTLGLIYQTKGEYVKADKSFTSAILSEYLKPKIEEKNLAQYYINRAFSRINSGNGDGALRDVKSALDLEPNNSDFYATQGHMLTTLNRLEEAKKSFDKASSLGASGAEFLAARAKFWLTSGNLENAIRDLEQVLILNPNAASVREKIEELKTMLR